jgi:hypothetical protein
MDYRWVDNIGHNLIKEVTVSIGTKWWHCNKCGGCHRVNPEGICNLMLRVADRERLMNDFSFSSDTPEGVRETAKWVSHMSDDDMLDTMYEMCGGYTDRGYYMKEVGQCDGTEFTYTEDWEEVDTMNGEWLQFWNEHTDETKKPNEDVHEGNMHEGNMHNELKRKRDQEIQHKRALKRRK